MRLTDFRALSFDCYGTLIDWETGLSAALAPLSRRAGIAVDDRMLAAFGAHESRVQDDHPDWLYPAILGEVHRRLAAQWGVARDEAEEAAFASSVGDWPAFPDTPAALSYLKGHFRLIILSNIDRVSFARSNLRLGVEFDHVFTAEEIGTYKPDPRNFEYLVGRLAGEGIEKKEILHVAQSLFHDHVPANRIGLASAWIDRRSGTGGGATPEPEAGVRYDFRFETLEQLAEAHRRERKG
ncbi:MAG TPA: haloacid dehalogenase type II [Allosphingosinicella sp.]|nr:haloacid dehalogenase type II [Allosphingosinicella sp.]